MNNYVISEKNAKNEKLKILYEQYLKYRRNNKLKQDTINSKILHIDIYDEFFKYVTFDNYTYEKGIAFYNFLKDKDIMPATMFSYLNDVYEFLDWHFRTHRVKNAKKLIEQLDTLKPRDEDIRLSHRLTYVEYPTIETFDKILDFNEVTLQDKRDKAILAFLLISCARVSATATAKIGDIDIDNMVFKQDPLAGVKTKRQKHILTKLLPFDARYTNIFLKWIDYLKTMYNFDENCPLFPKIKMLNKGETILKDFMSGEAEFNKILETRCKNASVQKFHPHAFRHLGIHHALKYVRTGTQLKALSQNVGHEDITNILEQYAKMKPDIYLSVVERMVSTPLESRTVDELSDAELSEILTKRLSNKTSF